MSNYNKSADFGKQLIFQYIKERMLEKNISHIALSRIIEVKDSTLRRNFNGETEMQLITFLKICGALEIRPYLIPAEDDTNETQRISFN